METRNRLAVVLVVLVGFAATGCATGGYLGPRPYGGPLGEVVSGNLAMTCPGDYFVGPPVNKCLRQMTGISPRFAGYPMHVGGSGGRELSRAEKIAIVGGGAAVVGGLITRDWKGAVIGGTAGVITTALLTRGRDKDQPVVVREGQQVRIGADGVPVAVGQPVVQQGAYRPVSSPSPEEGGWTIKNRSGFRVELWREERFEALLQPGQTTRVINPDGMTAVMLIPNPGGVIDKVHAQVLPNHDFTGWDLVVPAGR